MEAEAAEASATARISGLEECLEITQEKCLALNTELMEAGDRCAELESALARRSAELDAISTARRLAEVLKIYLKYSETCPY